MTVGVVTIAHGRHEHLARQQRALAAATPTDRTGLTWVLVSMDDPVIDTWPDPGPPRPAVVRLPRDSGRLPLAAARNAGAARALAAGADVLVFLDVDCLPHPAAQTAYHRVVRRHPGTIWSGPVTYLPPGLDVRDLERPWTRDAPHPGRPAPAPGELVHDADPRLFWSLSFAMDGDAWRRAGGFCEDYTGYGGEDTDFALSAGRAGLRFGWVGAARAYHQWHPTADPPVHHAADIVRNATLFHERWGWWPMEDWLRGLADAGVVERTGLGWRLCAD